MQRVREARSSPPVIIGVVVGLAVCLFALFCLFLNASTHMVMKAKCAPLMDPILEHKKEGKKELWRASLRVEVLAYSNGAGKAILSPDSTVYDSGRSHPGMENGQAVLARWCDGRS
eukprot:1951188-Rhodomonas_salina.2